MPISVENIFRKHSATDNEMLNNLSFVTFDFLLLFLFYFSWLTPSMIALYNDHIF